jgi:dTDP-4-amino-4,6-dideoxygalactose transaminase
MLKIPHSYPYLTSSDKESVLECFELDYVGYDEELSEIIIKQLKKYLAFSTIQITTSASLALMLLLKHLKLESHNEIILPAINCWSVYNTIMLENVIPVFCDVRASNDFRLNYLNVSAQITHNTRAIIITHMYGVLIEEEIIKNLKETYPNIIIIEDFSTSLFSKEHFRLGQYSDFAIGSFGSTKPLTGGIGGVLCSKEKIVDEHYDQVMKDNISFNVKISRLNQTLLISQLKSFSNYKLIKKKLILFYSKYVLIYTDSEETDLFRAITFDDPKDLVNELANVEISLDIRQSVQPNSAKELQISTLKNANNFSQYYSLPLNIKAYNVLKDKGFL